MDGMQVAVWVVMAGLAVIVIAVLARDARRAKAADLVREQQWRAAQSAAYGAQPPVPGGPPQMLAAPPSALPSIGAPAGARTNTFAVLALVFGILGGLIAIVFGHIALHQIRRTGEQGRGMAITGLVIGYVVLAVWVLAAAVLIARG